MPALSRSVVRSSTIEEGEVKEEQRLLDLLVPEGAVLHAWTEEAALEVGTFGRRALVRAPADRAVYLATVPQTLGHMDQEELSAWYENLPMAPVRRADAGDGADLAPHVGPLPSVVLRHPAARVLEDVRPARPEELPEPEVEEPRAEEPSSEAPAEEIEKTAEGAGEDQGDEPEVFDYSSSEVVEGRDLVDSLEVGQSLPDRIRGRAGLYVRMPPVVSFVEVERLEIEAVFPKSREPLAPVAERVDTSTGEVASAVYVPAPGLYRVRRGEGEEDEAVVFEVDERGRIVVGDRSNHRVRLRVQGETLETRTVRPALEPQAAGSGLETGPPPEAVPASPDEGEGRFEGIGEGATETRGSAHEGAPVDPEQVEACAVPEVDLSALERGAPETVRAARQLLRAAATDEELDELGALVPLGLYRQVGRLTATDGRLLAEAMRELEARIDSLRGVAVADAFYVVAERSEETVVVGRGGARRRDGRIVEWIETSGELLEEAETPDRENRRSGRMRRLG